MENLSPDGRAIYDLLKADTREAYEERFLAHKKEVLDAVRDYVDNTNKKFREVNTNIGAVRSDVAADIAEVQTAIGADLESIKVALSSEIHQLSTTVDRALRAVPTAPASGFQASTSRPPGASTIGPVGHRDATFFRGMASPLGTPPPAEGTQPGRNFLSTLNSASRSSVSDISASAPRVELPQFDGTNPRLWQRRCEEYFQRWSTPGTHWVQFASSQFSGSAATWLEAFLTKTPQATWEEFVAAIMGRFMRNQHQVLLRRMYRISQSGTVEDYVRQFSDLVDQLAAYDPNQDPLNHLTRFLDGLKPTVRVLVAIQQPADLDAAFTMALLYEELGDGSNCFNSPQSSSGSSRRSTPSPVPPPSPPSRWISKTVEEKKQMEASRSGPDDRWTNLKAYRRAKGLCFICGEKWGKEHQCKSAIQLHVVKEMLDCLQLSDSETEQDTDDSNATEQVNMVLSAAALGTGKQAARTMQLAVTVQGQDLLFLVDSGSSTCFIDERRAQMITGVTRRKSAVKVQVAGGATLACSDQLPELQWETHGIQFADTFRVLALNSYDGILGLDWLAKHSPMLTHWAQNWIAININGKLSVLHGAGEQEATHAVLELHLIRDDKPEVTKEIPSGVQSILDQFTELFEEPVGLPPRRQYDHQIPLIPGARPVTIRPYRVAPELKTEIEQQIAELLRQGVISHSNSPFASPVLLVRKSDRTWRLVVDYRHLNALTVKGKYPLPVIDELLDELAGSRWFSKLDLRAGYHQIRLAPGEEYKTAFQVHNGHYEFKVMAFGLSGAPATFQFAMNAALAPVLRKCALVFFDDILIYSATLEDHLVHVRQVLGILKKEQWKVKRSKCEFAQNKIAYLGHVISDQGVSTDTEKIETVRDWPQPKNLKELRAFLGLCGYYRKFIQFFAIISQPLTALLKKGVFFVWTNDTETAFQTLKQALITAPVLALPDFKKQFVVETDACDVGIGAVLSQAGHPVAFVSRALGPRNQGLSVYEKEYLAILLAVEQWRSYLQLGEFVIRTDHKSLTNLTDQRLHTDWQRKALTKMMGLQYTVVYKKGIHNGAADALSRKPTESSQLFALTTTKPAWLDSVEASYVGDSFAQSVLQKLAISSDSDAHFSLSNGILRFDGRIWIGSNKELQSQVISAFHDSPQGGHSGFPVTYRRLLSLFKWPGMKAAVRNYVQACQTCQQAKPERVHAPGLLQPLPIPSQPWEIATMDFIEGLPSSRQYSCIMVIVDKLTKYAHFIPLHHPYTACKVAEVFVDNIYRLHGLPLSLVSDRDPVFTSNFWQGVFRATGTQLRMSTAHHPETDGQTERVNQSIECYLRCFISSHPQQWSKWLPLCEFWYNTNWHSSLGKTPFEVLYGRSPRYFGVSADSVISPLDVQSWLQERQLVIASVRQHLLRMQQRMKAQADKNRTERTFNIDDMVFLKLQPYIQSSVARRANHKLAFKFFGPFRVVAKVGDVAYKLELPPSSKIHPVFHVSQLRACVGPGRQVLPHLPLPNAELQVPLRVLQRRVRQDGLRTVAQVLLQWSGATVDMATWEDEIAVRQQFPHAPAWGQAGNQDGGIVSDLGTHPASPTLAPEEKEVQDEGPSKLTRPKRNKALPAWLSGPQWSRK